MHEKLGAGTHVVAFFLEQNPSFVWSAQRNLLNSFINLRADWKINYHFSLSSSASLMLLLVVCSFITLHTRHTQATPCMALTTWFISSCFHSHFVPRRMRIPRCLFSADGCGGSFMTICCSKCCLDSDSDMAQPIKQSDPIIISTANRFDSN